jgi:hypothetical protein
MTKNLEKADTIIKLTLAITTIVLYLSGVIAGPFGQILSGLSVIVIVIYLAKIVVVQSFNKKD